VPLLQGEQAELLQRLARAIDVDLPPRALLDAALHEFFGFVDSHPIAARVLADEPFGDAELERLSGVLHKQTRAAVALWIESLLPELSPELSKPGSVVLDGVYGALVGFAAGRRDPCAPSADRAVEVAGAMLWHGLLQLAPAEVATATEPAKAEPAAESTP